LREYYAALVSTNDPDPSRFFPYSKSFLSSGVPVRFEYLEALERDSGCVTFLCRTVEDTSRTVVVKFTETYCPEAHELLAAKGMAPELLYCGSVDHSPDAPSYQSLKMIVMEYIDGKTAAQLQNNLPEDFAAQLSQIVSVLHTGGYVFGDLRLPNIMVEKKQVKLIDFDWAGKVGLAKYPIHLARNISWPTGVVALGQIEKAHDLDMLRSLITTTAA
jgi:serine/threonine protein kinase